MLGLGLGRQVVCTWLQVMEALGANKTIEHIGLFGNHDNMERPHVQSAPPLPAHAPHRPPTAQGATLRDELAAPDGGGAADP